jgi:hypothetical protein
MAKSTKKRDTELAGLLEEVRSLREDIDVLKRNPVIGEAVTAALAHAREVAGRGLGDAMNLPPNYAVAVRDLPPTYEIAVRPVRDLGEVVQPEARTTRAKAARATTPRARAKGKPAKARAGAATRKRARTRKAK